MSSTGDRAHGPRVNPVEDSGEAVARESAESDRFRALADHATELVAEFDEEGRYLYASPSYRTLLGLDPSDLIGTVPHELVHPEDRRGSRTRFDGAIEGETESRSVHRLRHRDGSWRWFDNAGRAYRTAKGALRFVSLGRDITERKQTDEALARRLATEQRLLGLSRHLLSLDAQHLIGALEESLAVAGELASADRAYLVALREGPTDGLDLYEKRPAGAPPLDLVRLPWLSEQIRIGRLVHCGTLEELPQQAASDRDDLAGRGVCSLLGIPLRAGTSQLGMLGFEVTGEPHDWSIDEITLLSLCADIFASSIDRLRTETALDDSRLQLVHAQKMEAVGRLAGGIAHDFNNLLMVIGGFSASLTDDLPEDHPGHDDAREIEEAVGRAAKLTEQLLTLSRRQVVEAQRVDLNAAIAGRREIVSRMLGEDVELRLQIDPSVATVRLDPGQLEQVVVNLAMNARNAMTGGGTLIISTHGAILNAQDAQRTGLPAPGAYAVLGVQDTGCGMDEDTQARVFEPFFTTREHGKGTGLGLSIVYGLVRQWNGAISLWSRPNEGTRIQIYLPTVAEEPEVVPRPEPTGTSPGSETVLLAEDEAPVRKLLRRVLLQQGYTVLEARDGIEAVELAEANTGPIDILVTDVVMPRMGGVALARRLRGDHPGLPVLFVSGHPEERTAGRSREMIMGNFIQKPCSPRSLLAKVRETLEAASQSEQGSSSKEEPG
jgi:two-component system cell cycle sensor histidine kinase/response regulator CckA